MPGKAPAKLESPSLGVSRADAAARIGAQIEKGSELWKREITSQEALSVAYAEKTKWISYTRELLSRIFTNDSIANAFSNSGWSVSWSSERLSGEVEQFRGDLRSYLTNLEAVHERLDLIPEELASPPLPAPTASINRGRSREVFVVHGWDEASKQSVARVLESLDLKPIILAEQTNKGMTVIEKVEAYSDVEFAVVLLTPDDVGGPANKSKDQQPRARQNVILELGYFVGKLGRARVCALLGEGVEIPSDYLGVVYTRLDEYGAWKLSLAREIKASGIDVDLNKAFA